MRGMLPFFFGLARALRGSFQHGSLNGLNNRVRILAGGQNQRQFIPKPLARSRKIEVVALDGETVGESNAPSGGMAGVGPITGFQQYRMKHSELDDFPGDSVNLHPIT